MADQTVAVSPFSFVMNNPVMLTDPDGRLISGDTAMVNKLVSTAGSLVKSEKDKQSRIQSRIDKREAKGKGTAGLERRMDRSRERVSELKGLASDISELKKSAQEYHVSSNWAAVPGADGVTEYNAKTGAIDINISASYGLAGLAHELTHAYQYDQGLTDMQLNGNLGYLHDITDEQSAYRRQFAIKSGSLENIQQMSEITDSWVRARSINYTLLPAYSLTTNSSLRIIIMTHRAADPNNTNSANVIDGAKSYKDVRQTIFPNFISR